MLQSNANWKDLDQTAENELIEDVPIELSPIVKKLLLQRGISFASEAKNFLSPDLENLQEPEDLKGIDKAAKRIHEAIANKERVLIYGDYDADGVTSTAVLYKALNELGADCAYYIPNRFTEGYGLNEAAIYQAKENGFELIITVDTGISAVKEANLAKKIGIDLIITDHHEVQEELPEAIAIIHPACSENYYFKDLAGVGVAFKLSQYLLGYFPEHLLEFVAIGTIADLVPLHGENRVLTYYGLEKLSGSQTVGIQALKDICRIEGKVTEENVGFMIGPRLNAVGRLQDASLAVELLLTDSKEQAAELAAEVDSLNQKRQKIVSDIMLEAEKMVNTDDKGIIIVSKEGWNEGVLGIVASKLVQKFDRPAIVLNFDKEKGVLKGSARSIPAFDLFTNCMKIRSEFIAFGGHAQAAGMTIFPDKKADIQTALDNFIAEQLSPEDFKQQLLISGEIDLSDINEQLINEIEKLAPYGMGNPKPLFKINHIPTDIKQIGSKRNHLKLLFSKEGKTLDGIAFGMGQVLHKISPHTSINAVGELGINEWNGNRKPQIMIKDLCINEWQLFDYRGRKFHDVSLLNPKETLVVTEESQNIYNNFQNVSYMEKAENLHEIEALILADLPKKMEDLIKILQLTKPKNIYACYHIRESAYLTAFPAREDFIWLYALVRKHKVIDMKKELQSIMKVKSWSRDKVIFISQVFEDLGFINIEDGVIHVNPQPEKKELEESKVYQERIQRLRIEKDLYYSNYQQFKEWFTPHMNNLGQPKEEIANGI